MSPTDWRPVSGGLRMIATAMVIRLILAVVSLLMVVAVAATRNRGGMDSAAVLLAVVGLASQLLMVIGMFKVAQQPVPARSAGTALIAGTLGIIGAAASVHALITLVRLKALGPGSSGESIESAMEAARHLPAVEVVAAATGFLALVLLLAAAAAVARQVGRQDLARRATIALGLVVLGAATYAFAKLGLSPRDKASMVTAFAVTAAVQVAAFVAIISTARRLAAALGEPAPPELPRARSV